MLNEYYLNSLKIKYNYDEKTLKALDKIISALIKYYGSSYENLIYGAISNCKIIPCSSKETISKIKRENTLSAKEGMSDIETIEIKGSECCYISDVKIDYNEEENKYFIKDVTRVIATSHTFNYDSPKGLEVLTYAIIKLLKSYNDEFLLEENTLTKRTGFEEEKRHIVKEENNIYLDFISHEGHGLEEGFNIYDTSKVVSIILDDNYKCYDYDSIYTIASVLKEKFNLKDKINEAELSGNTSKLKEWFEEENLYEECDECLFLENEMFIAVTREDKNEFAEGINNKLSKDIFNKLISIYEKKDAKEKIQV